MNEEEEWEKARMSESCVFLRAGVDVGAAALGPKSGRLRLGSREGGQQ